MTDQESTGGRDRAAGRASEGATEATPSEGIVQNQAPASGSAESEDVKEPTPEEQLAAYEEALKNDDWGHQPC